MTIEGCDVVVVEGLRNGQVLFCPPGHILNQGDVDVLVCNLVTYVSLESNPDAQKLVAALVEDERRVKKIKQQAQERRDRRAAKWEKLRARAS